MKLACLCLLWMHRTVYRKIRGFARPLGYIGDRQGLSFITTPEKHSGVGRLYQTRSETEIITSTKGNTIKRVRKLLLKSKYRYDENMVVVENPRLVADVYANQRHLIRQILVDVQRYDDSPRDWRFLRGISHGADAGIELIRVSPEVFNDCTDTVNNQGMLAVCDMPSFEPVEPSTSSPGNSLTLILDGVSDPGNLGTLVRSAAATNVSEILLLPGSCDPWNPKAVRSAAATTFLTPIQSIGYDEWQDRIMNKNDKVEIYAATMADGKGGVSSLAHTDIDWSGKDHALILGSEGSGLSPQVLQQIGGTVKAVHVPMMNHAVESLNVAVCGSIILFERARQLSPLVGTPSP